MEILVKPIITEKMTAQAEKLNRYGFVVAKEANKLEIKAAIEKMYGVKYEVIRNMPLLQPDPPAPGPSHPSGRFVLYQGAVNEGRCFESLIPAMKQVDAQLVICGKGNFMSQARQLVEDHGLQEKVIFKGPLRPEELKLLTRTAWCGITLFEKKGMSNFYSLANRFFDYMHAGIPQLAMDYPAYREINNMYTIAVLIDDPDIRQVAGALNSLLNNMELYQTLQGNCKKASIHFNWQEEEKKLVRLYQKILN